VQEFGCLIVAKQQELVSLCPVVFHPSFGFCHLQGIATARPKCQQLAFPQTGIKVTNTKIGPIVQTDMVNINTNLYLLDMNYQRPNWV